MSKEKKPYRFETFIPREALEAIRAGKYPVHDPDAWDAFWEATGACERVLACLEYPAVDIELEMWTAGGGDVLDACPEDCEVSLSYFACIAGGAPSGPLVWQSDEGVSKDVEVDFSAEDWEKRLEEDMNKAALQHAKENRLSLTEPNF